MLERVDLHLVYSNPDDRYGEDRYQPEEGTVQAEKNVRHITPLIETLLRMYQEGLLGPVSTCVLSGWRTLEAEETAIGAGEWGSTVPSWRHILRGIGIDFTILVCALDIVLSAG